jgi:DNA mismatch repair protein MutS2
MASEISSQVFDRIDLAFLPELASQLAEFPLILQMLNRSIDMEGNILDSSSSILSHLRKEIRRLEMSIQKKLEEMMRDNRISLFLQDDFITKRAAGMLSRSGWIQKARCQGWSMIFRSLVRLHLSSL